MRLGKLTADHAFSITDALKWDCSSSFAGNKSLKAGNVILCQKTMFWIGGIFSSCPNSLFHLQVDKYHFSDNEAKQGQFWTSTYS
jgi:hypothetical protein